MGLNDICSAALTPEEEAAMVAFQLDNLLPLNAGLDALQPGIAQLIRSSLHRCLQRYGISCLPDVSGDKPMKKAFKADPIGSYRIELVEAQTGASCLYLFAAIDRASSYPTQTSVDPWPGRAHEPRHQEATVKRYHYDSHDQLKADLQTFLMADNFTRRLKILKGPTPYLYICKVWATERDRLTINPAHLGIKYPR